MNTTAKKNSIGLALGSGAARGLAHIGALKVLEDAGIEIELVTGTSMGAFIGALYAAGVPVEQMEKAARELDWRRLAGIIDPVLPISGLIDGKKLKEFMAELLPVRSFEDLRCPLAVTATDIHNGDSIIIKQGDLLEALHASLAFPGIFSPVKFGRRHLVDGGLCNPVPVDIAHSLGAKHVVGICTIPKVSKESPETFIHAKQDRMPLNRRLREMFTAKMVEKAFRHALENIPTSSEPEPDTLWKSPNIFRVFAQSVAIMENEINELRLRQNVHDLIIRPNLEGVTLLEFHKARAIIAAGETATRANLESLQTLLQPD